MKLTKREKKRFSMWGLGMISLLLLAGLSFIGVIAPDALAALPLIGIAIGITYAESNYLSDVILQEEDMKASRDEVTVLSGQNLTIGTVLGKITKSTPTTGTADAGNTGNGTCTTVTGGPDTKLGTYTLECVAAAANGGTFKVIEPDGGSLPDATVGTAFTNDQLNFTINDGSTDFVVGDIFTIAVVAGSGKVKILTPAAVDGTQNAYGLLASDVDASSADVKGAAIVREAIAKDTGLVWPAGITDGEKAAALTELEVKHITVRTAV